ASVTTTAAGGQTYTGAVTLGNNVNFTGAAASLVWFKNTVDGVTSARSCGSRTPWTASPQRAPSR
ncbi:MAG: hypothetical protein ABSG38_15475, partial [Spirochaetia bacterium]